MYKKKKGDELGELTWKTNKIMGSTLSVLASVAILRSSFNEFVPPELRNYIREFSRRFSSELTVVIKESHEGSTNHLFKALVTFLGSKTTAFSSAPSAPRRLTVGKNENLKVLTFGLDSNSEIVDVFHGVPMKWTYLSDFNSKLHYELRWYELRFHKQHADLVKTKYLPYILDMAKRIKDQNRVVKFYTTRGGRDGWSSKGVNLDHPMTFDTLAMDGDIKQRLMDDLDGFIKGKDYYKKIGKVWKRGYLLYGPPGTGKSSLIAAMANYLNFDMYNLNLSSVSSDSALEHLLLHISNRSILVVEDIDCSIVLQNRQAVDQQDHNQASRLPQVTLCGLLNAIDGLLSCCGEERIIVFTTNYKDRIDPALLRAGRMDMHIHLSYCTFSTFKQLANSYLEVLDHDLFPQVENLIRGVQVSAAEVAGELMKAKDPKTSLAGLVKLLKIKGSEANAKPKKDSNDSLDQKNDPQVRSSSKAIDKTDDGFPYQNGVTSPADPARCDSSVKVTEYTIKEELGPIFKVILAKHGDIAANSSLQSAQCRSSFVEIVCNIIQKLEATNLNNLTQIEVKSMLCSVQDLEAVRLQVGWLRERLDEILQAMPLIKHCAAQEEDKEQNCLKTQRNNCFHYKSLVDGLL